mgnify:CR=1 FL=1
MSREAATRVRCSIQRKSRVERWPLGDELLVPRQVETLTLERYAAERAYYLYTPYPKNVSSWTPWVKNYGCKNSFDRGAQLEVVWLDK